MGTPSFLDIVVLAISVAISLVTLYLSLRELKSKRESQKLERIKTAGDYQQEFEAYMASELDKILVKFPDIRINRQLVLQKTSEAVLSEKELLGESIVLRKLAGKIEELSISKTSLRLKRLFDVIFSTIVCAFILIWLVPTVGILIRLESPGPILFIQKRTGRYGQPFLLFKFRTVAYYGDSLPKGDPYRLTRIGRFLRRINMDEMPSFLNVLIGDMSVVGPRPHSVNYEAKYWNLLPDYYKRYAVPPGITGLAQIRDISIMPDSREPERRLRYDLFYIKKYHLGLDLLICWWSLKRTITGDSNAW